MSETTGPERPLLVPNAATWCPVRDLWIRWQMLVPLHHPVAAYTAQGGRLALPGVRPEGVPGAATWEEQLLLWKRRGAGKVTGPAWWTWRGDRLAQAAVDRMAAATARPVTRPAVAPPEAEKWAWCPVRKLHLRRETDQATGEERWLARTADWSDGPVLSVRPSVVPPAASWDDRAKLWALAGSPATARGFWTWDGRELHPREVEALAPRPQGPWELSTAEARRTLAAAPKASPALVMQARIEVARVRGLHEVQAAELRALEGLLGELDDSVLSALLPLLRAGSLSIAAAIRRPADLPLAGS